LHDSNNSFERKEIYMRFDFISRKVVQTNPTLQIIFCNASLIRHIFLGKTSFSAESIDGIH